MLTLNFMPQDRRRLI